MAIGNCHVCPYIEGDLSTLPGFYLEDLLAETDVTVVAQLANNMQYILTGGTCKGGFQLTRAMVRCACVGRA